ncbi:tripartite tricarboxylate transporter permease [Compostimonas suwonensis]|uniref:Putative tricarboxylic transport membrane protein n=1 Tax=Compostimonas suwonensis TaxID=1048394 RepID=A0A2M9C0A4_9MICO|nr:tripartite tricarboxylate transporter permease [Compostimonas suwonensis]PJJ63740.1 putative tricarboxylic transport membrane protein [Compostimonas suwonensis]
MDPINGLLLGFSVLFTPENLLAGLLGAIIGTLTGVLPGIGPTGAMSLLLPLTFVMSPTAGLIMLAGIYYGSMYGGSTTAILLRIPGEAASIVTSIDGYQMSRKGRAGAALAVAAVGSAVAGTIGVLLLMLFAPTLASLAINLAPPEYCLIALLGLLALSFLTSGSRWKSIAMVALGLGIATVGTDPTSGMSRFTFGSLDLSAGLDLVPIVMGLFGMAEVLKAVSGPSTLPSVKGIRFRELFPSGKEWKEAFPAIWRGSFLGFGLGLVPGPQNVISSFASYRLEQRLSKRPEEFGHGAIRGVAGPESANNAATSGQMVPLLALGIPFSATSALLLAALQIQNVQPGPLFIQNNPAIFWGVIASMYLGNLLLLILNLPLVGIWVSMLRIPQPVLLTIVTITMFVGAYSLNNRVFDVGVMVAFGFLGWALNKLRFDLSPMILALVLGGFLETAFRQSMYLSRGDFGVFVTRPVSAVLVVAIAAVLAIPIVQKARKRKHQRTFADVKVREE